MKMSIKILGSLQSTCTQRVLIVLHELGQDYKLVNISMMEGEHTSPAYVRDHHPFGVIPVLYDGPIKLFESRAISRYLVRKFRNSQSDTFVPNGDDLESFGLYEQALSVEYSYFDPSMKTLSHELLFKGFMGHGPPDEARVEQTLGTLRKTLDYYEDLLKNNSYLAGNVYDCTALTPCPCD
ncbi:hypothetical protein ACMFMF_010809 [Clarireedia jacksonii]